MSEDYYIKIIITITNLYDGTGILNIYTTFWGKCPHTPPVADLTGKKWTFAAWAPTREGPRAPDSVFSLHSFSFQQKN